MNATKQIIATKRERNLNFLAWPALDQEKESTFTPCRRLEFRWASGDFEWPSKSALFATPVSTAPDADADILAGRVETFDSVDEMLNSLKRPKRE